LVNQIKKTADGSTTLISDRFNQPYHSLSGAVAESRYVYFEVNGLLEAIKKEERLNILEIGFGTGMNLIILLDYLEKTGSKTIIKFYSVEAFPIDTDTAASLHFGDEITDPKYNELLSGLFSDLNPGWNKVEVSSQVTLNLFIGDFKELRFDHDKRDPSSRRVAQSRVSSDWDGRCSLSGPINFILHDPFSPESNPAGWTPGLFSEIASVSANDAVMTTYSAASSARAAMALAGWKIARAPGALGKREMTVASLSESQIGHLKRVNELRLIERFKKGEFN